MRDWLNFLIYWNNAALLSLSLSFSPSLSRLSSWFWYGKTIFTQHISLWWIHIASQFPSNPVLSSETKSLQQPQWPAFPLQASRDRIGMARLDTSSFRTYNIRYLRVFDFLLLCQGFKIIFRAFQDGIAKVTPQQRNAAKEASAQKKKVQSILQTTEQGFQ